MSAIGILSPHHRKLYSSIMGIDWHAFDWPSFATMFAGILAVAAAMVVGVRQISISKRQTDISEKQASILERQVLLQEAQLRADLFERRLATFEATADFLIHLGSLDDDHPVQKARVAKFTAKLRESQFLFSPMIYEELLEIFNKSNELRVDRATSIALHKDGLPLDPKQSIRITENISWSLNRLERLAATFKNEISILF